MIHVGAITFKQAKNNVKQPKKLSIFSNIFM